VRVAQLLSVLDQSGALPSKFKSARHMRRQQVAQVHLVVIERALFDGAQKLDHRDEPAVRTVYREGERVLQLACPRHRSRRPYPAL